MSTFGEILKGKRKEEKITLKQISIKTNISMKYLRALENENFEIIPGKFHFKKYLRGYLETIGIDEKIFFEKYKEYINSIDFRTTEISKVCYSKIKYSKFRKKNIFFNVFFLLLLFGLLFYLLFFSKLNMFFGNILKSNETHIPESRINFTGVGNNFSFDYSPINVVIKYLDYCWTKIQRGNKVLIEKIYKKGDKIEINGYEIVISVGNSSAMNFYLNGTEIDYFKNSVTAKTIRLSPDTIDKYLLK